MSVHRKVTQPGIYFITFTCHKWLPLIQLTSSYNLIYNWFSILTQRKHAITGFVIMPNHIHLLLYYNGNESSLNTLVGNGKRFMAYDIINRMKKASQYNVIKTLQRDVKLKDKSRGKIHQVWKDSFDVKECRTEPFIMQKLNYIHNNPCSGKWSLANSSIEYEHSSAPFYISGKKSHCIIKDYREFISFDYEEDHSFH